VKQQISTVVRRLRVSKPVGVAAVAFGVLSIVPYLARTQEQSEVGPAPESETQTTPISGVTSSTQNPLQIALLHWYNANLTTTFTVGGYANAVAFDGANIWVTSQGGTVASCGRATARRSGPSPSVATPSAWPLTGPISG